MGNDPRDCRKCMGPCSRAWQLEIEDGGAGCVFFQKKTVSLEAEVDRLEMELERTRPLIDAARNYHDNYGIATAKVLFFAFQEYDKED